jgi:hypothetical protein
MRRPVRNALASFGAPAVGFAFGAALVSTYPYHGERPPAWYVWAPLAVALATAAGAVLTYGCHRWAELNTLHVTRTTDVAVPVVSLEAVGIAIVNVPALFHGSGENWRGGVLVTLTLLMAYAAAGAMYGVRYTACCESSGTHGTQLVLLVSLRRLLERLLAAVGSLVALATLQQSALMRLDLSSRPPQYTLIFGGFGSLLVALVYVPAWAALRDRGLRLCDELFPMGQLDQASVVLSAAGDRQKIEQILGADRSVLADLQTGLAILAPLIASAAAAFLPH